MILHIRQLCWSYIKKALKQYFLYEVVFRIKQFETRLGCVVDMHIIDISWAASNVVQVLQKKLHGNMVGASLCRYLLSTTPHFCKPQAV